MKDLSCPCCSKHFRVNTKIDLKVKCPHCGSFLRVVTLDGTTMLCPFKIAVTVSEKGQNPPTSPPKVKGGQSWRPFVAQKNRLCANCGRSIKKYQSGYGLIEGNKVTRVVCAKCDSKRLPPDEENPINKMAPNIVKKPE
jgi:DNA-directed RNA polymerase subunit RPC12/RpoP